MNKELKKKPTESFEEYAHRISSMREELEMTWTHVAALVNDQCGCDYSADTYRKKERKYQLDIGESQNEEESSYINSDKETITINYEKGETTSSKEIPLTDTQLRNPNELLKAHGFDPKSFTIKSATNTKTIRTAPSGETNVYSSKIIVKQKEGIVSEIDEIISHFEKFKAPKLDYKKNNFKSNEYLVVPLYDLHFGRIPDVEDYSGYNVEDEKNRIINHVKKYIEKFNGRHFKTVHLVVGQDFLNSSFTGFTSSQSHLQSNALDFRTMFKAGSELLISIIDMFAKECNNLNVIGSLGNHDTSEEVALFSLIKAYYRNSKTITVDDGTHPRKYLDLGNSCVGLGHLDKENKRTFGLMQIEAKELFARTKVHIFIAGHFHCFSVANENGVELYRVPSICPPDRWTVEQGYVMNEPKTMCFIFDEDEGLTETHFMYL